MLWSGKEIGMVIKTWQILVQFVVFLCLLIKALIVNSSSTVMYLEVEITQDTNFKMKEMPLIIFSKVTLKVFE